MMTMTYILIILDHPGLNAGLACVEVSLSPLFRLHERGATIPVAVRGRLFRSIPIVAISSGLAVFNPEFTSGLTEAIIG
jgi:hypothetical protein